MKKLHNDARQQVLDEFDTLMLTLDEIDKAEQAEEERLARKNGGGGFSVEDAARFHMRNEDAEDTKSDTSAPWHDRLDEEQLVPLPQDTFLPV